MPNLRPTLFIAGLALGALWPAVAQAVGVFGATPMDTSAFALGRVRLNVIFLESNGQIDVDQEDWTAEQLTNVRSEVDEAVAFWEGLTAGYHPNARLQFDVNYVNGGVPMETPYEPIRRASTQESFWINHVMGQLGYFQPSHFDKVRAFDHDQRTANDAHWSTTLFVVNDEIDLDNRFSNSQFAYGFIGGPYLVATYGNNGWGIDRFNRVLSHELAHSFFALDEYAGGGARNNEHSGYLGGINGNSQLNAQGQTITPPQPDALMMNNTLDPSDFTDVQLGHRDSDGDTVPDILDTVPFLSGAISYMDPVYGIFSFAGDATVVPLPNLNTNQLFFSSSGNAMTINWIAAGQYRLNAGEWIEFAAADGAYDTGVEALGFTLNNLAAGLYTIDVRAINSVDNGSNVLSFSFQSSSPVPEPPAGILAAVAASLALAARRRRSR